MKKIAVFFALFHFALNVGAQFSNENYIFKGLTRQYRVYVPPIYDGSKAVPLLICLHGLGDNMNNFSSIGMNYIADTANFISVFPQAIVDPVVNSTAWNSGAGYSGYYPNSSIDDVGFIRSLIDTLSVRYSIDQQKIFACGFSMGAFMTNRLGCEANDRISAIASVAGTIGTGFTCTPGKAISACHFHGTADGTVSFADGPYGMGAQTLVDFWVNNNNCSTVPIHTLLPDLKNDGYTVDYYEYSGGDSGSIVDFYKVNNANHVWMTPVNDISYSIEIWKFFNKKMKAVGLQNVQDKAEKDAFDISPNPASGVFNLKCRNFSRGSKLRLTNINGEILFSEPLTSESIRLDLSGYPDGVYFVALQELKASYSKSIILKK